MRSLSLKLTLLFLLVSLTGIALVAAFVWGITASEFNRFVSDRATGEFVRAASSYYITNHSWDGVESALQKEGFSAQTDTNGKRPSQPMFPLLDAQGHVVINGGRIRENEAVPSDDLRNLTSISVNGQVIGYVMAPVRPPGLNPIESRFLSRMNLALIVAALAAATFAILLGLFLARNITRPLKDLTAAASAIANGHLSQQLQVRSKDELGELTRSFNKMSADLENSNTLRRQMTADIAHDLRTPLTVITGYLEGLKDGVVRPSPARFEAMYSEAIFLQRLVEDLRTLSLADAGELSMNKVPVQPSELLARLAASFQAPAEQYQVRIVTEVEPNLPAVSMDPERMVQAMGNLIGNALRYTPDGGEVRLSAEMEDDVLRLDVVDNGTGILPEDLPRVFDRFYRGDDSRQEGGSGLGLAIARSIVELHKGSITVFSEGTGKGSRFTIRIPASSAA